MDGKYVGNRPIKLSKIKEDDVYGKIDTVSVSGRKVRLFHLRNARNDRRVDGVMVVIGSMGD